MKSDFERYTLAPQTLEALENGGITRFLPVQRDTWEPAMAGEHLLVQSPTGTGKTLAYLLPALSRINPEEPGPQVLIVLPTRELAAQVHGVLADVKGPGVRQGLFIGGANKARQQDKLKEKPHVLIGTPGRLTDVLAQPRIKTDRLRLVVVDEADKLADERFAREVESLLSGLPVGPQFLLFSATVSRQARQLLETLNIDAREIVMSRKKVNEQIEHWFMMAEDARKFPALRALENTEGVDRALIFITRNAGVEGLVRRMRDYGFSAAGIHSGMAAQERKKLMQHFRSGKVSYLVTTDILARGMDVPDVKYIINYDLPKDPSTYVHRAGRTARAGRRGIAVTFVEERKKFVIRKFERKLEITFQEKGLSSDGTLIDVAY